MAAAEVTWEHQQCCCTFQVQTCFFRTKQEKKKKKKLLGLDRTVDFWQTVFYRVSSAWLAASWSCREPPDTKNIAIVGFIYHSCCTVAPSSCSLKCLENGVVTIMKIAILQQTRWLWQQQLCATLLTNYDFKKAKKKRKKKDNRQTSNNHPHYCTRLFLFTGIFSRTRRHLAP